jgi:spoVT / abrB like domain
MKGYKAMSDKIVVGKRVSKWGNGLGILLPKQVVEKMELKAGDKLVLEMEDGVVTLKKESDVLVIPRYKLEDLLKGYEGYQNEEYWKDVEPVGEEVW